MTILRLQLAGAFAVSVCMMQGCGITAKDADGNVYKTVRIGKQVWTVENLRTTKYNDGTPIPRVTDSAAWVVLSTPGYCYCNNTTNTDSIKKYGALYNWYAVDTKGPAPAGWRVPTDDDWKILENYLAGNGYNWDRTKSGNKIAKSLAAKTGWSISTNAGAIGNELTKNNRSGFSALPGGCRSLNGDFIGIGDDGYWWSATELSASYAFSRGLDYDSDYLYRGSYLSFKSCGFSVLLVRN